MGISFNKRDGVGMGATRPEPAQLPFLYGPKFNQYEIDFIIIICNESHNLVFMKFWIILD